MNKTIIAIYGRQGEGKSDTIKRVCKRILKDFPNARKYKELDYSGDILVTIRLGNVKIGIESQGDPNSRMIKGKTIQKLADPEKRDKMGDCDIIICATRTEGKTVKEVDKVARKYGYSTLWISSFFGPSLNHDVLNEKAARNVVEIIKSIIVGQI